MWQRSGPLSRLYSFDFSEMLKRWILLSLLQVVSHKLLHFEEQACNTRAHHQIPLRLVLSFASNFPAAPPSTRQGMHPLISLETLKLRRMNLLQDSSCYRISPKLQQSQDFSMQSDLMRQRNCRNKIGGTIHLDEFFLPS